jgi:hypothetical protein
VAVEAALLNRAAGALLGSAVGDALAGGGGAGWVSVTSTALASLGPAPDVRSALGEMSEAGAGVLWALAIRHTVLTGELDPRVGLSGLSGELRSLWGARLDEAERLPASTFSDGSVVHAVQAAWSSIFHTDVLPYDPERHLADALENSLAFGGEVAALSGGLLGACHGVAAVPREWATRVAATELVEQARNLATDSWAPDPDDELFRLPEGD